MFILLCIRCKREIPDESLYCPWCGRRQSATAPAPRKRAARRSPGSGNIHKLSGYRAKPYEARIGQKSIGCYASKGEAVLALDYFLAAGKPLEAATATFEQVYTAWSALHYTDVSKSTQTGYINAYSTAAILHRRRMADLRTGDYQQVIDGLVSAGKSFSACSKQNGLFIQLNTFAMERDLIDKNYASFVRLPKKPEPKKRVLSTTEQQAIWAVALSDGPQMQIAQIAVVLFCTGMRIGELLSLRSEDVHLEEGYAIGGEKTKAGRNRVIPLPGEIHHIIASWLANDCPTLLANRAGNPMDDSRVRHRFIALMDSLDIHGVTPHTCRHTCATMMAAAGVPPKAIQTVLGHASYSTTATIYTHPQIADLVRATQSVSWNCHANGA